LSSALESGWPLYIQETLSNQQPASQIEAAKKRHRIFDTIRELQVAVDEATDRWHKAQAALGEAKKRATENEQLAKEYHARYTEADDALWAVRQALSAMREAKANAHLFNRVNEKAQDALLKNDDLKNKFKENERCDAFVMSIDIRRSTDLMLKAKTPQEFANFITRLCLTLRQIILDNGGVFDKFTGDGILAFFPLFFAGPDAGMRCLQAAELCHSTFANQYAASRKCFTAVLKGTGLGIGIDFGSVQMVQIGGDLTVVGNPVVYACRMGSAPAGTTLMNQPAYDEVFPKYSSYLHFEETEVPFKHEGPMLAYSVSLHNTSCVCNPPNWLADPQPDQAQAAAEPKEDAPNTVKTDGEAQAT
jgi:class 3 adenylate cyclase